MKLIADATDRRELERVLGRPRYALLGDPENAVVIRGKTFVQDRVEVFEVKDRLVFDFSFAGDTLIGIAGCVKPWIGESIIVKQGNA